MVSVRFLAFEGICGQAFDLEAADDEEPAGVFFLGGLVDAGGDEEVGEIRSAEGAGGGFQTGQGDAVEFVAGFRIETGNAAAVAKGDPQVAVGIDGHAVGRGVDVAGGNHAAEIAQMAVSHNRRRAPRGAGCRCNKRFCRRRTRRCRWNW